MTDYIIKWILLAVSLLGLAVSICCIKWHNELHKQLDEDAWHVNYGDYLISGLEAFVLFPLMLFSVPISIWLLV